MFKRPRSRASNPSQQSLDTLFEKVILARVLDGGTRKGKALGNEVLLRVSGKQEIASLHRCLSIIEKNSTFGHCMCDGDQALELYTGRKRLATIGLHHGRSIRWDAWKYDALLRDGRCLLAWLAERGVKGPLAAYEEDQRRAEQHRRASLKWQRAMPRCLGPFWDTMQSSLGIAAFLPLPGQVQESPDRAEMETGYLEQLLLVLAAEYPDIDERIRVLFRWFGSGEGPWSGYPSYESVAEALLFSFPVGDLVAAVTDYELTPEHLEGAARLFAGYYFNTFRQRDAQQIPRDLKQSLLAHSLKSSDEDKVQRARSAFSNHKD